MLETFLEVDLESPWVFLKRLNEVDAILYFVYDNISSNYLFVYSEYARIPSYITVYPITQSIFLRKNFTTADLYAVKGQ